MSDEKSKKYHQEYSKKWYLENRTRLLEKMKAYDDKNREKKRSAYWANAEDRKQKAREYRKAHAAEISAKRKSATPEQREAAYKKSREWAAMPENQRRRVRYEMKKRYGLTEEQYDARLIQSCGRCEVCGVADNAGESGTALCLDHDHVTGDPRGLICRACNSALGLVRDSPETLVRLAEYLCRHRKVIQFPKRAV